MSEIGKRVARTAEKEVLESLLSEIQHFRTTTTEFASRYFGQALNNVLAVETVIFDATGYVTRSYPAAVGAVEVRNHSTGNTVTLAAGGSTGSAPLSGVGVYLIPKAPALQMVNIGTTTFTIYGTAGEKVSFTAFVDGGRSSGGA